MELTIHLFTFWIFLCLAIKYFNGVSGQTLTLSMNDSDQITPCTQPVTYGLRYGIPSTQTQDSFFFRGIVNATGINLTTMLDTVYFQRNRNNTSFTTGCTVFLSQGCNPTPVGACYCTSQNNQVYQLMYRNYAGAVFLDTDVRMEWSKADLSSTTRSNVMKVPPLYDITNPNYPPIELTLELNGQKYPISGTLSGPCSFSFVAGHANKLELTPNKAARPCYLKISASSSSSSSSGSVQSSNNGTDYTSITVTPANVNVTTSVEIEYFMCVPGSFPLGSCVAASTPLPPSTTTPTSATTPATTTPQTTTPDHRKCCKEQCCSVSIAALVPGSVLFLIGIVLAILLCLEKIQTAMKQLKEDIGDGRGMYCRCVYAVRIILVKVYTGVSCACGAVSLIIGAISTSEYCDDNCRKCSAEERKREGTEDSLEDCPLGIVSAVVIGSCAVDIVLGVALLTCLCCQKKKGNSELPHDSSNNTQLTSKNRRPSHVAPAKHPVDNTDMPDGGNQPRHTPDSGNQPRHKPGSGNQPRHTPDSGNQSRHKPDGGDKPRHKPDGGDQPRHKTNDEDKPRPLPTPLGSDAAISTSTTSHLPLNSNFSTIGKTLDSQANRPTSIDGTRQLPQLRNERGHKL